MNINTELSLLRCNPIWDSPAIAMTESLGDTRGCHTIHNMQFWYRHRGSLLINQKKKSHQDSDIKRQTYDRILFQYEQKPQREGPTKKLTLQF